MAVLLSCQDSLLYSEYKEIPNAQWDSRDTLSFQLPKAEYSLSAYLTISVRTRQDYNYKAITLKVEHLLNDTIIYADTLHIPLCDANGHPLVHAFPIADNYSKPIPLNLKRNECHTLHITHDMRLNPLNGIPDVGVFVERE